MLTEQQNLIVAQYKQSVADAIAHNKNVMAKFAEKFQKPFKAKKIIVPGIAEPFWKIASGPLKGFCIDGANSIRYDFSAASYIVSDEIDVYPHNNRYGLPLGQTFIYSSKIGVGGDSVYFSPEFDREEVEEYLGKLHDKPDLPLCPSNVRYNDWVSALDEQQEDIPY